MTNRIAELDRCVNYSVLYCWANCNCNVWYVFPEISWSYRDPPPSPLSLSFSVSVVKCKMLSLRAPPRLVPWGPWSWENWPSRERLSWERLLWRWWGSGGVLKQGPVSSATLKKYFQVTEFQNVNSLNAPNAKQCVWKTYWLIEQILF